MLLCTVNSDSSCKGVQYFNMTNILLRVIDLSFIAHCLTYSIQFISSANAASDAGKKKREICRIKRAVISQLISIEIL